MTGTMVRRLRYRLWRWRMLHDRWGRRIPNVWVDEVHRFTESES